MFHKFFMKMNLATGGVDPHDAMNQALVGIGLQSGGMKGAVGYYRGAFRGRPATLRVDGSAVMQAANGAMLGAAGLEVANAAGLVSDHFADWRRGYNDFRARNSMREAQMDIRATLDGGRPPAAPAIFGRLPSDGHPIAPGLFCQTSPEAWPHLAQPYVIGALGAAPFDRLQTDGAQVHAIWLPEMRRYQQVSASPATFQQTIAALFGGLNALADILYPRQ